MANKVGAEPLELKMAKGYVWKRNM